MFNCPVCGTEYATEMPKLCHICNWDLTPDKIDIPSKSAKKYQDRELARIKWAKQIWENSQKFDVLPKPQAKKTRKKTTIKEDLIGGRLEQIETELTQAKIDRDWQQSMLIYLQSQLDWALYRLEQFTVESHQEITPTASPPMSEVGIDYHPLMNLMSRGKWRKADEQTWEIILKITAREDEGWLNKEDIMNFPCTDLYTINQLWEYYSGGLFGIGVQQQIFASMGHNYTAFCDQVGWRTGENWAYYDDLCFDITAPPGHLPVIFWRKRSCYGVGKGTAVESLFDFTSRLANCSIFS